MAPSSRVADGDLGALAPPPFAAPSAEEEEDLGAALAAALQRELRGETETAEHSEAERCLLAQIALAGRVPEPALAAELVRRSAPERLELSALLSVLRRFHDAAVSARQRALAAEQDARQLRLEAECLSGGGATSPADRGAAAVHAELAQLQEDYQALQRSVAQLLREQSAATGPPRPGGPEALAWALATRGAEAGGR